MQDVREFTSKKDTWVVLVLWASLAFMLVAIVTAILSAESRGAGFFAMLFVASVAGLAVWIMASTKYRIHDARLEVISGPFRWNIPIDSIESVTPSRSLLAGPALSLDRLRIRVRGRRWGLLVSPRDREGFLQGLASAMRGARIEGERLIR